MRSPIFVALDTPDLERAKAIATRVRNHVGGIKLGLEFFCANGRHGVREMAELDLPIFLDLKLHDIPNTVGKAIQALRPLEPAVLTVHAGGHTLVSVASRSVSPGAGWASGGMTGAAATGTALRSAGSIRRRSAQILAR